VRGKHERLSGMLIAVKAGVKHLAEKVAPASADLGDRKGKGANGAGAGEVTDETVVAALAEVERAVHRLLSRVKAKRAEELSLLADDDDGGDGDEALLKMSGAALLGADVDDAVLLTRPHNQRISLPTPEGGWPGGEGKDDDGGSVEEGGEDGEELTRDRVKKHASVVLQREQKAEAMRKKLAADRGY